MATFSWKDIIGAYQARQNEAMGYLEGYGQQQKLDLQKMWEDTLARQEQQARGAGWGRATVIPTLRMGVKKQQADSMKSLEEQLASQRLKWSTSLSGEMLAAKAASIQQEEQAALAREQMTLQEKMQQTGFAFQGGQEEANRALSREQQAANLAYQREVLAQQQRSEASDISLRQQQLAQQKDLAELNAWTSLMSSRGGGGGGYGGGGMGLGTGYQIADSRFLNQGQAFGGGTYGNRAFDRLQAAGRNVFGSSPWYA